MTINSWDQRDQGAASFRTQPHTCTAPKTGDNPDRRPARRWRSRPVRQDQALYKVKSDTAVTFHHDPITTAAQVVIHGKERACTRITVTNLKTGEVWEHRQDPHTERWAPPPP